MAKQASLEPGVRFIHLDAVRGVAALTVVLFHYWHALPAAEVPAFFKTLVTGPGIRILFTGSPAVMVFFVLSGYVLSLPYHRGQPPSYRQFAVRRVFRIYVPYIVAIAIAALLISILGSANIPQEVVRHGTLSLPVIIDHVLMIGLPSYNFLDPPVWSLVHEMRISVIFPLLIVFFARAPLPTMTISLMLSVFAALFARLSNGVDPIQSAASLACLTLQYVVLFVAGIALAHYGDEIKTRLAKSLLWIWLGLEIVCYLLFDAPWGRSPLWLQPFQFGLAGAMAIALVCASARAARILSNAFFGWLGRISYSLYLLHLLVLGTALETLGQAFGRSAAVLTAFIASFVVAHVSYLVLERPCVNLGRRLTKPDPIEPSPRSALSVVPATAGSSGSTS